MLEWADDDWYKFTLSTSGKVNITLIISRLDNFVNFEIIDVSDDNNKVIVSDDSGQNINKNYIYYLTAGDYYIHFYNTRYMVEAENYDFKLTFTPYELAFEGINNNSINKASEIELETEYSAHIANNDSKDYYTFNLDEDDDIALNFKGDLDSVDWILYNNKDEEILNGTYTRNNDISDMIVSNNYVSLKSGEYTLVFVSDSNNYSTYNFSLSKYVDFEANGISIGDFNNDGMISATDVSVLLEYYSYLSTGGEERDMRRCLEMKE